MVLAGTEMINLTAAKGTPIQAVYLGLALQTRSLAALATTTDQPFGPVAQPVPEPVDRSVATDLVSMLIRV
ncbi:hypothetical protein OG496_11180 [Streptomyces sp. NBC_00988]|uniref:hypothetical protein n=1 Tax=Streptomyces sp. NBC_00988 TaxID=2903704 RepID=UPI003866EF59|nr:hypothetical protein OG496_11180 [Streptomyces sp. NBC_00988]